MELWRLLQRPGSIVAFWIRLFDGQYFPDVEILMPRCALCCLPRLFTCVFIVAVYITPNVNRDALLFLVCLSCITQNNYNCISCATLCCTMTINEYWTWSVDSYVWKEPTSPGFKAQIYTIVFVSGTLHCRFLLLISEHLCTSKKGIFIKKIKVIRRVKRKYKDSQNPCSPSFLALLAKT